MLHEGSMLAMILVGIAVLIACFIAVKKDEDVTYGSTDKIGVILNFAVAFAAFPFITLISWLIQAFETGPDWIYQACLCIPALILFSLAASISLRRKGFAKSGLAVQLIGPVSFVLLIALEYVC